MFLFFCFEGKLLINLLLNYKLIYMLTYKEKR